MEIEIIEINGLLKMKVLYITIFFLFLLCMNAFPFQPLITFVNFNLFDNNIIVLHGHALFLKEDFSIIYVNVSICRYGRITVYFTNNTYYSYGYACTSPYEKPHLSIDWVYGHHLNITMYTPFFIEVAVKTPIDIVIKKVDENKSYVKVLVVIIFKNNTFGGIIPLNEIGERVYAVLINNKLYSLDDPAFTTNVVRYIVTINKENNYGWINGTFVGFFPLYIITPVNAHDIEELVKNGILKFTEGGFVSNILNYLGHTLYLNYGGPKQPLQLYTTNILTFNIESGKLYNYIPYPLYWTIIDEKRGAKAWVPLDPDIARPPFKYDDKYIMNKVAIKLAKTENELFESFASYRTRLVYVNYLYHYPLEASLPWPIIKKDFIPFNASYIYLFNLHLDAKNLSIVSNYVVGYLDPELMRLHEKPPWELLILTAMAAFIACIMVITAWRRRYLK